MLDPPHWSFEHEFSTQPGTCTCLLGIKSAGANSH
jgi:hypothetical protein